MTRIALAKMDELDTNPSHNVTTNVSECFDRNVSYEKRLKEKERNKFLGVNLSDVTFTDGEKTGCVLMIHGYKFRYKSKRQLGDGSVKYYSCAGNCGVRCRLFYNSKGVLVKADVRSQHNHPTHVCTTSPQTMKKVLNRILDSPCGWADNSTKLYGLMIEEIQRSDGDVKIKSRLSSVKRYIRVVKKRHFKSYDVMADEKLKELFVPIDPERADSLLNDDIIILCNKEKVRCLSGVKYILMDGTFKVAPPGFLQVYTIHGAFRDRVHFTMFYVLMKKRRARDYEKLFNRLQSFCIQEFNFSLFNENRTVITDYERAVFSVLTRYRCNIQGCFFNFTHVCTGR